MSHEFDPNGDDLLDRDERALRADETMRRVDSTGENNLTEAGPPVDLALIKDYVRGLLDGVTHDQVSLKVEAFRPWAAAREEAMLAFIADEVVVRQKEPPAPDVHLYN